MPAQPVTQLPKAGLFRRVAALAYDSLVLFMLAVLATIIALPFAPPGGFPPGDRYFQLYLLILLGAFYGWFWVYRGQTIGMLAWRIQVSTQDGSRFGWQHAMMRLIWSIPAFGLGGLGLLWLCIDPQKLAVHDRLSKTAVVVLPR